MSSIGSMIILKNEDNFNVYQQGNAFFKGDTWPNVLLLEINVFFIHGC